MEIWQVALSSAVVSGFVSTGISGWFSLRSKRDEYANSYYKLVLEKRLAAYETVEKLILSIKTAVVDESQEPYHFLFANDDDAGVYAMLHATNMASLWLSDELCSLTRELSLLFFSRSEEINWIDFGKKNYRNIAEIRTKVERRHTADLIELHDVPRFLKSKKTSDYYTPLPVKV